MNRLVLALAIRIGLAAPAWAGFAEGVAEDNLGIMYGAGEGVPRDHVRAHMWWDLSAAQGNKDAAKSRDVFAKLMTPAQIAEAQRLARERKPKK